MIELRATLTKKLCKIEERKNALVDRMVEGVIDRETYRAHDARYGDEAEQTKAEIRGTELEEIDLESVLKFADRIILRPARLWVESSLGQRQRLQKTLLPNGINFDGEQFGTDASPLLFRLLDGISDDDSCLASLSAQSLNQFNDNVSGAEALSAVIAEIYRTSPGSEAPGANPSRSKRHTQERAKRPKDRTAVPLTVFE